MKDKKIQLLAQGALIAAIYVVLTWMFAAFSFGEIQIRLSEALAILPIFTPAAIPGLFVGCLLGNILGGAALPDIIFGSVASLIGAICTRKLRHILAGRSKLPIAAVIPPVVSNAIIVPFVLRYAYGITMPIPLMMLTVGIGEIISCGVLGLILYGGLRRVEGKIFDPAQ